jgi:Fe2+ transport system protein FeoA
MGILSDKPVELLADRPFQPIETEVFFSVFPGYQ